MDKLSNIIALLNLAVQSHQRVCVVPYKRNGVKFLNVLVDLGYINYFMIKGYKVFVYLNDVKFNLNVVSSPGRRCYVTYGRLLKYTRPGFLIMSTSCGLLTHAEACVLHVGGEVVASIF